MRTAIVVCFLLVTTVAFAELQNGGFEDWDGKQPAGWTAYEPGFAKTDDALKGKSALLLHTWYQHLPGKVESGEDTKPGYTFSKPPALLKGHYKYIGTEAKCANAHVAVVFYKPSGKEQPKFLHAGEVVTTLPPIGKYTMFELKVPEDKIPAGSTEVSVRFQTDGNCEPDNECCSLYLDEIELQ